MPATSDRAHEVVMARPTLTYDPALDGLRAVAVMAVMIYHGFLGWGGGGFLGVDLFFVLSGYLITTLLLLEHRGTGTIALGAFWFRRAKRLLPGLFLVLAWISVYASFFAPEGQLDTLRRETIATLFYVANWELITSGESYFEQFLSPSPLRHVWSLAIEEQWYLVWPLVCAFGLGIRSSRWRGWVPTLAAVAVGSAVVMALLVRGTDDTNRAYYGTDARVQALVIGAVLAFVLFARRTGTRPMRS
ncbi:MAG: acyltransferase, partial [Acidimicrobiia bacterium]|nr:acyltransferase [Acidimicrobiia bacterium]